MSSRLVLRTIAKLKKNGHETIWHYKGAAGASDVNKPYKVYEGLSWRQTQDTSIVDNTVCT